MNDSCFSLFEKEPYPCYWLDSDGNFLMNDAATRADAPLNDEKSMRRQLQTALFEQQNAPETGAHTLPLLTDALSMRTLTLLPVEDGMIAFAVDEKRAPVVAFSSQMREPLTNIFAILPLLSSRIEGVDLRYLEAIQNNCYQLLRLGANLENGSRIEKKIFDLQPVDGTALAESLCVAIDSVTKNQGVPIQWHLPNHPLPLRADPRLLSEAFLNVIRNSLQYTRDGNSITVRLSRAGTQSLLSIEDHGLGIKPEFVDRVFDPYFSVDPYGDSNLRPGLGLGLSVLRQTITGFGGTVNLESRFGEGTTIYISIPLDTSDEDVLSSNSAEYLLNRFSSLYVQLCGYCRLPELNF